MVGLVPVGTLSYNGYTFDGSLKMSVETRFNYDQAGRTVISSTHTITADAVIATAPQSTDLTMAAIRVLLSKPGGALNVSDKGFGESIAFSPGRQEVNWGPKPRILSWQPIANSTAARVKWICEVEIADCESRFNYTNPAVMAFNYSVNYSMDRYGFTTRSIAGYLQISQTRAAGTQDRSLQATADQYRELIQAKVPDGFRRTQNDWSTSESKNRLDFRLTDEEIQSPNPYPEAIAEIDGTHDVSWDRGRTGGMLKNTISMRIRRTKQTSYPPTWPWRIFLTILLQRREAALNYEGVGGVLLDSLSVSEDLFGYASKFRASYRILGYPSDVASGEAFYLPKNIINASGLFDPLRAGTWEAWNRSLSQEFSQRGYAGLMLLPGDDSIIDLCGPLPGPKVQEKPPEEEEPPEPEDALLDDLPPGEKSWAEYQGQLDIVRSRNVAMHVPLQNIEPENQENPGGVVLQPGSTGGPQYGAGNYEETIIQESGGDGYFVRYMGRATRVGHRIPRPILKEHGGRRCVEINSKFREANPVTTPFGQVVYRAKWMATYMVANAPVNPQPPAEIG